MVQILEREYNCLIWAVESVQFQEFLRTEPGKTLGHGRGAGSGPRRHPQCG